MVLIEGMVSAHGIDWKGSHSVYPTGQQKAVVVSSCFSGRTPRDCLTTGNFYARDTQGLKFYRFYSGEIISNYKCDFKVDKD